MSELQAVFEELRTVMAPCALELVVKKDSATDFYIDTKHIQENKSPLFFGAVQLKKSFVSFHLMPIYLQPELLQTASAELRKSMQGKSCFNFNAVDKALFKELAALTEAGLRSYKQQGFV